jgi:uncharacterized protein YoxC
MLPTWVGVVSAVSLAIIALAAIAAATALTITALGIRAWLQTLREYAGPALEDARRLMATLRVEVEGVAETSRDLRGRILQAADRVEARLAQVNALVGGVQGSVESTARGVATTVRMVLPTIRTVLRNIKLPAWGRGRESQRRLKSGRKKSGRKQR